MREDSLAWCSRHRNCCPLVVEVANRCLDLFKLIESLFNYISNPSLPSSSRTTRKATHRNENEGKDTTMCTRKVWRSKSCKLYCQFFTTTDGQRVSETHLSEHPRTCEHHDNSSAREWASLTSIRAREDFFEGARDSRIEGYSLPVTQN